MPSLSETFWNDFEERDGPCILGTINNDGTPNLIYVGVVRRKAECIEIVDSAFSKTSDNLKRNKQVSFLFITKQFKAYQLLCSFEYLDDVNELHTAKEWMPKEYSPKAVLRLSVDIVYSGAELLYFD